MDPESIRRVYLPGVLAHFRMNKVSNEFAAACKDDEIKLILKGFSRFYQKYNPAADRVKIAFGMDMARAAIGVMRETYLFESISRTKKDEQLRIERVYLARSVGIMFMLRRSEHLVATGGGRSLLLRRYCTFIDVDGKEIA